MSRRGRARLALELAIGAVRRAPLSAAVGVLVVAVGVVLLLAGLALEPAAHARAATAADRVPGQFGAPGEPGLLLTTSEDTFRAQPVHAVRVFDGVGSVRPPGLDRAPRPGEVVLSPALRALRADASTTLAERYPGRDVGTVAPEGLVGPRELVVWSGVPREELPADLRPVTGFGGTGVQDLSDVPAELRYAVPLVLIGFFLPLGALFAVVATTGTAARERRLAALRLVGVQARHCRLLAVFESVLLVAPGALLGVVSFRLLTPFAAGHVPVRGGVWPRELALDLPLVTALLVAVPALGAAATWLALRRVQVTPLGVLRRSSERVLRRRRLVPLAGGCATLLAAALVRTGPDGVTLSGALLVVATVLLLIGLLSSAPLICRGAAQTAGRLLSGVSAELAAARVARDAVAASRLVTGSALLVFVSGLLLSFFPLLATSNSTDLRAMQPVVGPEILIADVQRQTPDALAELRAAPAVASVVHLVPVTVAAGDDVVPLTAVDCTHLNAVVRVPACVRGGLLPSPDSAATLARGRLELVTLAETSDGRQRVEPLGELAVRGVGATTSALSALRPVVAPGGMLDVAALPPGSRRLATGGFLLVKPSSADREEVRTLVSRATNAVQVRTLGEMIADAERTSDVYRRITLAALGAAGLVGLLTLTSTLVQQVRDHRLALVALWVCGMPRRTLRSATLLQSALVILPVVAVSLVLGLATAAVFLGLADYGLARMPWAAVGLVGAGAALLPLLACALTLPALRATARPQLLTD